MRRAFLRRLAATLPALALAACVGGRERPQAPARVPAPATRPAPRPAPVRPAPAPKPVSVPPATEKAPPPAWVVRPVVADAVDVPNGTYRVLPGDTLRSISRRTGAGSEAIARANNLAPPFTIHPGDKLRIPGGRYHLVKQGEAGIAIARAYGVEWSTIVTLNQLQEPYILRTGQRILLPSRQQVAAMTMEQRAAAFSIDIDDLITGGEPALASNQKPVKPVATATRTLPASAVVSEPRRFTGQFDWPLTGPLLTRFGALGGGRISNGINIAAPLGTPIKAVADGTVAYVGTDIAALGGLVLIRHGEGWISAYAHASDLLVTRGQAVKRGQVIARSGQSGRVDQPQLHFELRRSRSPVDPILYLPARS